MYRLRYGGTAPALIAVVTVLLFTCPSTATQASQSRYTKLDAKGAELQDNAASWAMVRDNTTGLVWEVKTTDGSIHDTSQSFSTWDKAQKNFVAQLNKSNFGGFSDWRLPNVDQLYTILKRGQTEPYIDTKYFPNTTPGKYWVHWVCGDGTFMTKREKFAKKPDRSLDKRVRAVRGGKEE